MLRSLSRYLPGQWEIASSVWVWPHNTGCCSLFLYHDKNSIHDTSSSCRSVQDFKSQLLVSTGSKVEMMSWGDTPGPILPSSQHARGDGVLTKTAFFDAPLLVTSVQQVKDYLLVADVHQGIYFVRYKVRNVVEGSRFRQGLLIGYRCHNTRPGLGPSVCCASSKILDNHNTCTARQCVIFQNSKGLDDPVLRF